MLISILVIILTLLPHQTKKCPDGEPVCLIQNEDNFTVINQTHDRITVIFKIEQIENIKLKLTYPGSYEIEPNSIQKIIDYQKTDPHQKEIIKYDWWWKESR